jgi:antirestriction protein
MRSTQNNQTNKPEDQGPWDPNEEVGDIYSAEIGPGGQSERAERFRYPSPRIWIACLAAYNDGKLHGEWVDGAVEVEELAAAAQRVLETSSIPGVEEYAIFDSDEFGGFNVGEYERLKTVARVARGIREHGHAFAAWAELDDDDPDMLDGFDDAFLDEYESSEAWAREVSPRRFPPPGAIPETVRPYLHIDYAGWARAAELVRVHFSLESRPPWLGQDIDIFDFFVGLDVPLGRLSAAVDDWERELSSFSAR